MSSDSKLWLASDDMLVTWVYIRVCLAGVLVSWEILPEVCHSWVKCKQAITWDCPRPEYALVRSTVIVLADKCILGIVLGEPFW